MNNENEQFAKKSVFQDTILDSVSPKFAHDSILYQETDNLLEDTCKIVESARNTAYTMVDVMLVRRNWLIGKRIVAACLNENGHADYGKKAIIMDTLSHTASGKLRIRTQVV